MGFGFGSWRGRLKSLEYYLKSQVLIAFGQRVPLNASASLRTPATAPIMSVLPVVVVLRGLLGI